MRTFCISICALVAFTAVTAAQTEPPKLDKQKLQAYVRYAEGFTDKVRIALDDPAPSTMPGYYRILAHLTMGAQKAERVYYVTPDGNHVIAGSVWELDKSPFAKKQRC